MKKDIGKWILLVCLMVSSMLHSHRIDQLQNAVLQSRTNEIQAFKDINHLAGMVASMGTNMNFMFSWELLQRTNQTTQQ